MRSWPSRNASIANYRSGKTLIQRCGLCERCEMSVEQEQKIHWLYAKAWNQMCEQRSDSGRPCWLPTQLGERVCRSQECISKTGAP